jgi:polyvinyl alcohol dehydrogenase (cytochrome)
VVTRGWLVAALVGACLLGFSGTALADGPGWAFPGWTTYRHDATRTGADPETSLTPVTPTQRWKSTPLDGRVFGQPLVYGRFIYVATENDTVYALDSRSGAIAWQTHVGTAIPTSLACGSDVGTIEGITSTPVIDPQTGQIFVVADTWNGSDPASVQHQMFALNLWDGHVDRGPVNVEPPGDIPADQLQRAGLALDNGRIIIGYGGNYNDCGNYHGWLVSVPEWGGPIDTFEADSAPGENQGSIWGSGNAPAIDSNGDIWISTGNGSSTNWDYQEAVIELNSNMNVLNSWAPSYWQYLDTNDRDMGSAMPILLPDGLLYEIGKLGTGYLMSQNLDGLGGQTLYDYQVCPGSWGGGIYHNGVVYITCRDAGLYAMSINTTTKQQAPLSTWTVPNADNPPTYAAGLIWSANFYNGYLYGLNPTTGAVEFSDDLGGQPCLAPAGPVQQCGVEHFTTPSAVGAFLYMPNQDLAVPGSDQVTAFRIAREPWGGWHHDGWSGHRRDAGRSGH